MDATNLVLSLLVVLVAGLISGMICKRLGISLLVGYLVIGGIIGEGGLGLVSQETHQMEQLARVGALLLLFSIGIEFSLEELARLRHYLLVGGSVQMILVMAPVAAVCMLLGMSWHAALLIGGAAALSSTVLVFKSLSEWGQVATPHGRRAIGILLFQDIALVPLMLLVPLLTGAGEQPGVRDFAMLALTSVIFVVAVGVVRAVVAGIVVPLLANLRSTELIVLFTLVVLAGVCLGGYMLGLPPAVGALAAGLILSDNRLSKQIDTLILPYRESFAAVFFVTLGTLLRPGIFLEDGLTLSLAFGAIFLTKTTAAAVALWLVGLTWRGALGMGLGLAQLGEFSFVLLAEGLSRQVIDAAAYNGMLFVALGTLIITPQLLKYGLQLTSEEPVPERGRAIPKVAEQIEYGVVIGVGPIGRQIGSRLELLGVDVCLVDLSPINLYPFAQQGFHTVAGDARDPEVLRRANIANCRLAVISVPDDNVANQVVRSIREINTSTPIVVRCRYLESRSLASKAGANAVVSEEAEASGALLKLCEQIVQRAAGN